MTFYNKLLFIFAFLLTFQVNAHTIDTVRPKIAPIEAKINSCKDIADVSCVKKQLSAMVEIDQLLRQQLIGKPDKETQDFIASYNKKHTQQLKAILDKHFWVKKSEFGKEADNHAWLIAQHADQDTEFQHRVLYILEKMALEGETDVSHYAYLYDRIAVKYRNFGIKQKYGTQANFENGKVIILPYEGTEADVNRQRRQIGLGTIKEYLEELGQYYQVG